MGCNWATILIRVLTGMVNVLNGGMVAFSLLYLRVQRPAIPIKPLFGVSIAGVPERNLVEKWVPHRARAGCNSGTGR